jgi:hypothetical protein
MLRVEMLWDTGAATTVITSDVLAQKFRRHLSDSIHQQNRNHDMTPVQVSFVFEFSNGVFNQESIAWVMTMEANPYMHSGIILGQMACMDSIQFRAIPRAVLEAGGETVEERFWGHLIIESHVDIDGTLQRV